MSFKRVTEVQKHNKSANGKQKCKGNNRDAKEGNVVDMAGLGRENRRLTKGYEMSILW